MKMIKLREEYLAGSLDKHSFINKMHEEHQVLFEYQKLLENSEVESISISSDSVICAMKNGVKLFVDQYDRRFIPVEILNFKSFDPIELTLIRKIINQSFTVLDIGANIGWSSASFSKMNPKVVVHAFEPIPYTFDYLKRHVALNQCDNVQLNNFALSDSEGSAEFYWGQDETGSSSMKNIQERSHAQIVKCKLKTLDSYCKLHNLEVDFIKCDVEGAELSVFKGALDTLKTSKPVIFTEMLRKWSAKFGYHPNDIIDLLRPLGYQAYAFESGKFQLFERVTETTEATNFFFFDKSKHSCILNEFK
jgi:FkbM family methyltransferase